MIEINNLTTKKINRIRIEKIVKAFFKKYKINEKNVISLAIIGDSKMKQINSVYRQQNKATDVLSFSDLQEIIININQIIRQAKEFKKKVNDEFEFILVHGLLHLIGYNDETETDRLKMIEMAEDFLINLK
ncbi:MAG TPA: rRNA maturation RNase YbeY [bacterium]|nr:rRNA maturation RNase YbeY [bacterium]